MVQGQRGSKEGSGEEVSRLVDGFDELVHRISELVGKQNTPLMYRFKLAWVRLRAILRWRYKMAMEEAQDEHEEYIVFWMSYLDEWYEIGEDMTIVFHGGREEAICQELLW